MVDAHYFSQIFVGLELAHVAKNVRVAVRRKMSKEYDVVVVLEFVRERQRRRLLELVFHVIYVARIERHVERLATRPRRQVIVVVFNVEALTMPLDTVSFEMALPRVHKWLHALRVQTVILHEVEHVEFYYGAFLDIQTAEIEPLRQRVVRVCVVL